MPPSPPQMVSKLSQPFMANNFLAMQSGVLSIGTGAQSLTFTNVPSSQRVTFKLANTGGNAAYICCSNSANPLTAILSSSTPQPTSTLISISTCDCIPAGAILTQDCVGKTDMISAITRSGTTAIEITIGGGQ